ncbi:hypothetical protein KKF55_01510 [Patescibacteria group bacterium]|nr:hypothetical protein [Patescibacteria group bacterium]
MVYISELPNSGIIADDWDICELQLLLAKERLGLFHMEAALPHKVIRQLMTDVRGCDVLQGANVCMVDDYPEIMRRAFVNHLVAATGKSFPTVKFEVDDSSDDLVRKIFEHIDSVRTDLILMDFQLFPIGASKEVYGTEVVKELRRIRNNIPPIFGFSTSTNLQEDFIEAGAQGFVHKNTANPKGTVRSIAQWYGHIKDTQ